jgi:Na+-driven multidrug efflux pump
MLKATLIGGGVAGVASAIPVVNFLNCFCCALVIGGGFLAAFLYGKECAAAGVAFRGGNGAMVGLVSGLFFALAVTVVGSMLQLALPQPDPGEMVEALRQVMDVPPEAEDYIYQWMSGGFSLGKALLGFFFNLLIGVLFGVVGGLIGGAVFKVEPPPPAAPPTV